LCWLALAGPSYTSEEVRVEVEGRSTEGYEAAEEVALREAVRQAAGVYVDSQTRVMDFQLVADCIYSRSAGYVKDKVILSKSLGPNNIYVVRIKATVKLGELKDDFAGLKMLIERKGRPGILLLVSEGNELAREYVGIARTGLADYFEQRHFGIVDAEAMAAMEQRDAERAKIYGDDAKSAAVAVGLKAAYVMTGKVDLAVEEKELYGVVHHFVTATVRVKVVSSESAKLILEKSSTASVKGSRSAQEYARATIQAAAEKVREDVLYRLAYNWSMDLDLGMPVYVMITGGSSELLRQVQRGLDGLRDSEARVEGVSVEEVDTRGISRIRVWGRGVTSDWLAGRIEEISNNKLMVRRQTSERVECDAVGYASLREEVETRTMEERQDSMEGSYGQEEARGNGTDIAGSGRILMAAGLIAMGLMAGLALLGIILRRK